MKKFKSPVNFVLTLVSLLPLFAAYRIVGASLLTPFIAFAILLALQFIFNRHSASDAPNTELAKARAKDYSRVDYANANIFSHGGRQNSFAIVHTVVQEDETYHGAWLCWGAVALSYFVGYVPIFDKIFPPVPSSDVLFYYLGKTNGNLRPFYPFFIAIIPMAAADMFHHIFSKRKPTAAKILLSIFAAAGLGVFCYALMELMKY